MGWTIKKNKNNCLFKKSVNRGELLKFEDLSLENWNNRICVRSSNNIYNQSLVASLIFNLGEKTNRKNY